MIEPVDESHQHAILTPSDVAAIVDEAREVRKAIDEDLANPVALRILIEKRHESSHRSPRPTPRHERVLLTDDANAVQDAYLELGKRLDVYALALLQVTLDGTIDATTELETSRRRLRRVAELETQLAAVQASANRALEIYRARLADLEDQILELRQASDR